MSRTGAVIASAIPEYTDIANEVRGEVIAFYSHTMLPLGVTASDNSNYYHYYPFLFHDEFDGVSKEQFRAIAVSGVLYLDHICLLDNIADELENGAFHRPFVSALLHEQALLTLGPLFPPPSPFWPYLSSYHREFASAMLHEKIRHFRRVEAYDNGEYFRIAKGKSALSKGTTAALAVLAGKLDTISALSSSQDCFNAALQMYDDVKDWKDDLRCERYSYLLTRGILESGLSSDVIKRSPNAMEDLARYLYYAGPIEESLQLAEHWCDLALAHARHFQVPGWKRLIGLLRSQIDKLRADLGDIRVRTILRSRGYLSDDEEHLIQNAAKFLLLQSEDGYREAEHRMYFQSENEGPEINRHSGCVFQRAIFADVLFDLRDHGLLPDEAVATAETEILLKSRLTHIRGGWSYFPSLPDLPPDADDLGQILQVLVRAKHPSTSTAVDDSIELLFSKNSHANGSFETWIIDPDATDEHTGRIRRAIGSSWGSGPSVEVVANLCYGLVMYDFRRFRDRIVRAAGYVVPQQTRQGGWIAEWYATNWYAVYAATRFLAAVGGNGEPLERCAAFVTNAQRIDGGFGAEKGTPLETALALLTWSAIEGYGIKTTTKVRDSAVRNLQLTVGTDGTWDPSDFIQMDTNRAVRGTAAYQPRILTYKSRTLTTAYVLKALLAIRKDV